MKYSTRTMYGSKANIYNLSEFICDVAEDIKTLPTSTDKKNAHSCCSIGSKAYVIKNSTQYILNNSNQWVLSESGSNIPTEEPPISTPKLIRLPTVANTKIIFEFDVLGYEFSVVNFTEDDIYISYNNDSTTEDSWLIPADCASVITIKKETNIHGTQAITILPMSTSNKGVQVQCMNW